MSESRRCMGNLHTFLSVLLPASPTDLEEQAKRFPSASLQPLAVSLSPECLLPSSKQMHFSEGSEG